MQELLEWTNSSLQDNEHHPLFVIGSFIVEFLHIHPLTDGNGRLSRILTNLLLLQAGYAYVTYVSHEKLIEYNKTEYYLALRHSQKGEGIEDWLSFFLDIILKQSQMAVKLLTQEHIELLLSPKQLTVLQSIKENGELAAGDIAYKTRVARPTVNQALRKLLNLKAITRIGKGSATRYRII
ncbi:Fic family protein [Patescibacteria group bacterium]|nr:Fic family protein [Patescibacteria group bacterium]MBU1123848.1 Fic family protein [Patescibacteria group bacterium]MBU1911005.1 Fic family protein [Patescibacteria group bacterium]